MAHRFDVVAVGVTDERPVVALVILGPQAQLVEHLGTVGARQLEELPYEGPAACGEGDVRLAEAVAELERGEPEIGVRRHAVADDGAELHHRYCAELCEHGVVEGGVGRHRLTAAAVPTRPFDHPFGRAHPDVNLSLLRIGTTVLVLVTAAGACSDPEDSVQALDAPVTTIATVVSTSTVARATSAQATTATFRELLDDCVQYTQFAAFTGDPEMVAFWDDAGQDVSRLELECMDLAGTDPARLVEFSTRRAEAEAFLAGTSATSLAP